MIDDRTRPCSFRVTLMQLLYDQQTAPLWACHAARVGLRIVACWLCFGYVRVVRLSGAGAQPDVVPHPSQLPYQRLEVALQLAQRVPLYQLLPTDDNGNRAQWRSWHSGSRASTPTHGTLGSYCETESVGRQCAVMCCNSCCKSAYLITPCTESCMTLCNPWSATSCEACTASCARSCCT